MQKKKKPWKDFSTSGGGEKMQINLRRIKAERVFKKISQAQMAKKLGISRTSYAKKEEALERLLLKVQIQDVNYVNRI